MLCPNSILNTTVYSFFTLFEIIEVLVNHDFESFKAIHTSILWALVKREIKPSPLHKINIIK